MIKGLVYLALGVISLGRVATKNMSNFYTDGSLDFIMVADFGNFKSEAMLSTQTFDTMDKFIAVQNDPIDGIVIPGDILYPVERFNVQANESY